MIKVVGAIVLIIIAIITGLKIKKKRDQNKTLEQWSKV